MDMAHVVPTKTGVDSIASMAEDIGIDYEFIVQLIGYMSGIFPLGIAFPCSILVRSVRRE